MDYTEPKKKIQGRGIGWRDAETRDLLSIWGEKEIQEQLHSSHRNFDVFERIAREMSKFGHCRTAQECRSKTKVMRLEYKRVIDHNRMSGGPPATCPYYRELHNILQGDGSVSVRRVRQSLNFQRASTTATKANNSTNSEADEKELLAIIASQMREDGLAPASVGHLLPGGSQSDVADAAGTGCSYSRDLFENSQSGEQDEKQIMEVLVGTPEEENASRATETLEEVLEVQVGTPENGKISRARETTEEDFVVETPLASLSPSKRPEMPRNKERRGRRGEAIAQAIMENARKEAHLSRVAQREDRQELLRRLDSDSEMMRELIDIIRDDVTSSKEDRKEFVTCMRAVTALANCQMQRLMSQPQHEECVHVICPGASNNVLLGKKPSTASTVGLKSPSRPAKIKNGVLCSSDAPTENTGSAQAMPSPALSEPSTSFCAAEDQESACSGSQEPPVSERQRQRKKLERYSP